MSIIARSGDLNFAVHCESKRHILVNTIDMSERHGFIRRLRQPALYDNMFFIPELTSFSTDKRKCETPIIVVVYGNAFVNPRNKAKPEKVQ
jgi:hypothetical protein